MAHFLEKTMGEPVSAACLTLGNASRRSSTEAGALQKNAGRELAERLVPRRVGRVIPLRSGRGQMAVAEFPAAGEWLEGQ